jgi:hypothetical protein
MRVSGTPENSVRPWQNADRYWIERRTFADAVFLDPLPIRGSDGLPSFKYFTNRLQISSTLASSSIRMPAAKFSASPTRRARSILAISSALRRGISQQSSSGHSRTAVTKVTVSNAWCPRHARATCFRLEFDLPNRTSPAVDRFRAFEPVTAAPSGNRNSSSTPPSGLTPHVTLFSGSPHSN